MDLEPIEPTQIQRPGDSPDFTLPESARTRIREGVADSTRIAYAADRKRFEAWCKDHSRSPLPATPETLAAYVDHMCNLEKAPGTIGRAIGAIRTMHRVSGYKQQPDTELATKVLKTYKREWSDKGNRKRKATPAKIDVIRQMVEACDTSTLRGLRDRTIIILGFALMARRSELSNLDIRDIAETEDGLEVHIRYSKTDQEAEGVEVAIPYGSHSETCPVRTTKALLRCLAEQGITSGPILRPIDRHGNIGGTARAGVKSARLTPQSVHHIVRKLALKAGVPNPSGYKAHSLRAGGATAAYQAGASASTIATHGRWLEGSPVVLGYIRAVDKWKDNPMTGVGL